MSASYQPRSLLLKKPLFQVACLKLCMTSFFNSFLSHSYVVLIHQFNSSKSCRYAVKKYIFNRSMKLALVRP